MGDYIDAIRECLSNLAWLGHYIENDAMAGDIGAVNVRYKAMGPQIDRMRTLIAESGEDKRAIVREIRARKRG